MNTNPRQAPSSASNAKSAPVANANSSLLHSAKTQKPTHSHAAIATAAYAIWLSQGKKEGGDQQNWLEAEQQLNRA